MQKTNNENSQAPVSVWGAVKGKFFDILLGQRLRPILVVAAYGFILFSAFRLAQLVIALVIYHDDLRNNLFGTLARSIGVGLQFDAVVIGWVILPMLLVLSLAPPRVIARTGFRRAVSLYCTILMALGLAVEVVGVCFIQDFRRRLNWASIAYCANPREVAVYVWENYTVSLLVLVPMASLIFYAVYKLLRRFLWRGRLTGASLKHRSLVAVVLLAVNVLMCRGSFGRFPLRPGAEVHSEISLVNELSSNNAFTLLYAGKSAISDGDDEEKFYDLPDIRHAMGVAAKMWVRSDEKAEPKQNEPLRRLVTTDKPRQDCNVVLILMEGQSSRYVGSLGWPESHTPFFDRLCEEGVFFSQMYAVGARTSRGLTGVLCGHPDLNGFSVLTRKNAVGSIPTLPGVFAERGYRTLFVYGGDPDFDNMREFFQGDGVETFIGQEEISPEKAGNWGVPDQYLFDKLHEILLAQKGQKFFAAVLTTSNHKPHEIPLNAPFEYYHPLDDKSNKIRNSYRYADWALEEFFKKARTSSYFQNTIFVLVADHGHGDFANPKYAIDVPNYRVPCLFYAPGILPKQKSSVVASQTDIAPTLLAMLGGEFTHSFYGRDLMKLDHHQGFAFVHEGRSLGLVTRDYAIVLHPKNNDPDAQPLPVLFKNNLFDMEAIPYDQADRSLLERLRDNTLSMYKVVLQQYLIIKEQQEGRVHGY